jgi:hypothetical protein
VALLLGINDPANLEVANANARALWSYAQGLEMNNRASGIVTISRKTPDRYRELLLIPAYVDIVKQTGRISADTVRSTLMGLLPFREPEQCDILNLSKFAFKFKCNLHNIPRESYQLPVWTQAVGNDPNALWVRLFSLSTEDQTIWKVPAFLKLAVFSIILSDFFEKTQFPKVMRSKVTNVLNILSKKLVDVEEDHIKSGGFFSTLAFKQIARTFALVLVIKNLPGDGGDFITTRIGNYVPV